jgi:transposase
MRKTEFDHHPKSKLTFITPLEDNHKKFIIPPWCESKVCPRIIAGSIKDFSEAFNTQRKLVKNGVKKYFTMHYRTKKDGLQSMNIEKTCFGKENSFLGLYFGKLKTAPIHQHKVRMRLSDLTIASDCRLTYDKVKNQFYFNIPIQITTSSCENQTRKPVISLDPGIRTFQTGFALGEVVEFAPKTCDRLYELRRHIDTLQKHYSKAVSKRSKRMFLRLIRCKYRKIKNIITDMHWKTIKTITSNYQHIIIPEFKTQQIMKNLVKSQRFLLQSQSHYTFRMRLKWKCELNKCNFHLVSEEYTSKTCGSCGALNDVGGSKHYHCSSCGVNIDRDFNGARNILIKTLS